MDLSFDPGDRAFREEVRQFFREELPERLKYKVDNGIALDREDLVGWHKILYRKGWVAPNWPKEYGGPGWTLTQKYIFDEELALAGAPRIIPFGIMMCGPVLIRYGTEEQKRRFLPRMLSGEDIWCQGYSEPGSGSDLASLKTSAVLDGDHWVVNGSKIWTTAAHFADWVFLLVRTSNTGKKQEGISFLLVDLRSPGIEIRPIHLIDGLHETNQVFYTDVRVPKENLVGEVDKGWTIAKYLLGHERMSGGSMGQHKSLLRELKAIASRDERSNGARLIDDPAFRQKIVQAELELRALEAFNLRTISTFSKGSELGGRELGVEANIFKIRQTELHQRLTELKTEAVGYYGQPYVLKALEEGWNEPPIGAEYANSLTPKYLHFRKVSIYSGSNEIQRNIIAKAALGL